MSAIGTFESGEKKGGSNTFWGNFQTGVGRESGRNARTKIVAFAQQLRLRQDHMDISFYFYKLALSKGMTRGRKSSHVTAVCVYITCRTEDTSQMLIDFSDVL
jgi:transcription factor IIIB subunit 2